MPLYEYRCSSCGHQQEFLQKWSDNPITVCTACGKETFSKMVTAAGFQLKGSGWYATDFKGSGSRPVTKSGESKSGESKSGESKSDAGDSKSSDASGDASKSSGTACGSGGCSACR